MYFNPVPSVLVVLSICGGVYVNELTEELFAFIMPALIKLLYCPVALDRLTPSQIAHPLGSVTPIYGAIVPLGVTIVFELML